VLTPEQRRNVAKWFLRDPHVITSGSRMHWGWLEDQGYLVAEETSGRVWEYSEKRLTATEKGRAWLRAGLPMTGKLAPAGTATTPPGESPRSR
jgi:hypothetical protein